MAMFTSVDLPVIIDGQCTSAYILYISVSQTVVRGGPPSSRRWYRKKKNAKIVSDTERMENMSVLTLPLLVDFNYRYGSSLMHWHAFLGAGNSTKHDR
jgi:hypothetical protein